MKILQINNRTVFLSRLSLSTDFNNNIFNRNEYNSDVIFDANYFLASEIVFVVVFVPSRKANFLGQAVS